MASSEERKKEEEEEEEKILYLYARTRDGKSAGPIFPPLVYSFHVETIPVEKSLSRQDAEEGGRPRFFPGLSTFLIIHECLTSGPAFKRSD